MTVTAAQPAAAVRLERGAARRHAVRAVQALLFVGGLVVLGFVLGGQAHAAEQPAAGTPLEGVARTEPVGQLRDAAEPVAERLPTADPAPVAAPMTKPVTGPGVDTVVVTSVADTAVKPVVESVVTPVGSTSGAVVERVVEPVAEPVEQVVEGAVQGVAQTVPVPPVPARSSPAEDWPSRIWPGDGPGVSLPVPAQEWPQGSAPAVVHRDEPRSDEPAADASERTRAAMHDNAQAYLDAYVHRASGAYVTAAQGSPFGGRLPFLPGHAPAGPGGSAVVQSVGDGHTQRGGDQHGAWFSQGMAFGLVPGSLQPVSGTAVRERHRDVLEFPG
ncbi:hypothetical protein [Streptomyces sp. NPDC059909]|uniref:hypothetical protein n=1 Tax=Streptomyces sp. NPDC059909 TaxID=3346998 RepID=UPI003659E47D